MAIMICLMGAMLVVTSLALCAAGVQRGQDRMLQQLRSTLVDARVIEPTRSRTTSARSTRRRQAAELNQMNAIREELDHEVQAPTVPTRTYSLRYLNQRPSFANMKRRMSSVFGANLIDLNNEAPAQALAGPLRPEEEGDWV